MGSANEARREMASAFVGFWRAAVCVLLLSITGPAGVSSQTQDCELCPSLHTCLNGSCSPCKLCPVGFGLAAPCRLYNDTVCTPCKSGYYSPSLGDERCLDCTPQNRIICRGANMYKRPCNASQNTRCASCNEAVSPGNRELWCAQCTQCRSAAQQLTNPCLDATTRPCIEPTIQPATVTRIPSTGVGNPTGSQPVIPAADSATYLAVGISIGIVVIGLILVIVIIVIKRGTPSTDIFQNCCGQRPDPPPPGLPGPGPPDPDPPASDPPSPNPSTTRKPESTVVTQQCSDHTAEDAMRNRRENEPYWEEMGLNSQDTSHASGSGLSGSQAVPGAAEDAATSLKYEDQSAKGDIAVPSTSSYPAGRHRLPDPYSEQCQREHRQRTGQSYPIASIPTNHDGLKAAFSTSAPTATSLPHEQPPSQQTAAKHEQYIGMEQGLQSARGLPVIPRSGVTARTSAEVSGSLAAASRYSMPSSADDPLHDTLRQHQHQQAKHVALPGDKTDSAKIEDDGHKQRKTDEESMRVRLPDRNEVPMYGIGDLGSPSHDSEEHDGRLEDERPIEREEGADFQWSGSQESGQDTGLAQTAIVPSRSISHSDGEESDSSVKSEPSSMDSKKLTVSGQASIPEICDKHKSENIMEDDLEQLKTHSTAV